MFRSLVRIRLNSISGLGETRPEWNGFSRISGQPREVHPKFRNEIRENFCSIRSSTRISGMFGRMALESALGLELAVQNASVTHVKTGINAPLVQP